MNDSFVASPDEEASFALPHAAAPSPRDAQSSAANAARRLVRSRDWPRCLYTRRLSIGEEDSSAVLRMALPWAAARNICANRPEES
jgi:hypothetical protein